MKTNAYDAGYAAGQQLGVILVGLFILASMAGLIWVIVWAVRTNKKTSATAGATLPGAGFPSAGLPGAGLPGAVLPGAASPGIAPAIDFGVAPGEAPGPRWAAVHATGAPMTATITTANILAFAFNAPGSPATRIPKEGAAVAFGAVQAPPPGWPEPLVDVTITSRVYAPFTVRVVESGARQLSSWASA